MTILEILRTWGASQDAFRVVSVEASTPESWNVRLRTSEIAATPGLDCVARKAQDEARVWITFEEAIPEDMLGAVSDLQGAAEILPRLVSAINDTRSGAVKCSIRDGSSTPSVEITAVIYEDGFSRHTMNLAVLEIAKAYDILQRQYAELTGAAQLMAHQRQEAKAQIQSSLQGIVGVVCVACHTANPPGSRFCNQCGAPLPS